MRGWEITLFWWSRAGGAAQNDCRSFYLPAEKVGFPTFLFLWLVAAFGVGAGPCGVSPDFSVRAPTGTSSGTQRNIPSGTTATLTNHPALDNRRPAQPCSPLATVSFRVPLPPELEAPAERITGDQVVADRQASQKDLSALVGLLSRVRPGTKGGVPGGISYAAIATEVAEQLAKAIHTELYQANDGSQSDITHTLMVSRA